MKRFLTKYGIIALAIATMVVVTMGLLTFFSSSTGLFTNLVNSVAAPFRSASASVSQWVDDKARYRSEFDAMKEENAALKEQIAEMEAALRQAEKDSAENATLRKLLGLREQQRQLVWESARITERDASNWASTLRLNIGTDYGVAIGDCVITASGSLVGTITDAGTNWATCTNLIDTEASIGARVFRTGDVAVAEGDFTLMSENRLRLGYLPAGAAAQVGDLVVTSGLGGYYPADLVIGYVTEIKTEDDGLAQYAILRPSVHLDELEQVFVITDFTIVE